MTEALIDALADTVAAVKAKTLYESLNDINADTLLKALNNTLAKEGKPETLGDTLPNVEAKASADMQAERLIEVKAV